MSSVENNLQTCSTQRRELPRRSSSQLNHEKNENLLKTNLKKHKKLTKEEIYTKNTLKNFKVTNLETIYESPKITNDNSIVLMGTKRLKRLTPIAIGQAIKKKKLKRRNRIKKIFGNKYKKSKAIPMEEFLKTMGFSPSSQESVINMDCSDDNNINIPNDSLIL